MTWQWTVTTRHLDSWCVKSQLIVVKRSLVGAQHSPPPVRVFIFTWKWSVQTGGDAQALPNLQLSQCSYACKVQTSSNHFPPFTGIQTSQRFLGSSLSRSLLYNCKPAHGMFYGQNMYQIEYISEGTFPEQHSSPFWVVTSKFFSPVRPSSCSSKAEFQWRTWQDSRVVQSGHIEKDVQ